MPKPAAPNPFALLEQIAAQVGKPAIRAFLDHAADPFNSAEFWQNRAAALTSPAAPVIKRRKKRADAGKPRGPRMKKAKKAQVKAAPIAKKPRVQRAKPRVDPLAQVTLSEGAI